MKNYISKKYPKLNSFITNKNTCNEIPISLNYSDRIIIEDNQTKIELFFGYQKVEPYRYFDKTNKINSNSLIFDDTNMPYGINSKDTLAISIVKLKVNNVYAPEYSYMDLLNPNRYETILSIKPIKAYYSADKKYIFLYIYGKYMDDIYGHFTSFDLSYMAKLIFSKDGEYIGRMVERGYILNYFGFYNCSEFKGF